jgi:FtsH-binding integral membrane protein
MRLATLLLIAGLLALVFGLGFLLVPAALLPLYGVQPDPPTTLMSRFFGGALVQLGLALYLVREVREPSVQRGLIVAGVVGSIAGVAVALLGQLSGLVNALGWSTVAIYAGLLLGYASLLRARPAMS